MIMETRPPSHATQAVSYAVVQPDRGHVAGEVPNRGVRCTMGDKEHPTGGPHFVGKKEKLIEEKRSFRTLEGRDILIIYNQGVFHAMDAYCYHEGRMLETGDIEEIDGKMCIICPKHKYKITLAEGEGLYRSTDRSQNPPVAKWFSKGVKQRKHTVTETNGDVYVKLSEDKDWIDSDYFQGEKGKLERAKYEKDSQ